MEEKLEIITNYLNKSSPSSSTKATIDPKGGGVHVISSLRDKPSAIHRGDQIISCPALCIALDPSRRDQHCAYCCTPYPSYKDDFTKTNADGIIHSKYPKEGDKKCFYCRDCYLVSVCFKCQRHGVHKWHKESGECLILSCLVRTWHQLQVLGGGGNSEQIQTTSCLGASSSSSLKEEGKASTNSKDLAINQFMASAVDSLYLLVVRIMIRQRYDHLREKLIKPSKKNNIGNESQSGTTLPSPFPQAEWALFDQLYMAKEEEGNNSELIVELCQRIREEILSSDTDVQKTNMIISEENFKIIMRKVVGCSHAITNVNEPLGCQYLGRALFLQHSFYNHCCTPNAFLSCSIPTVNEEVCNNDNNPDINKMSVVKSDADNKSHQCSLIGQVYCVKSEIQYGEPITLSYIPTSGLDWKERQQLLRRNYDFDCSCDACKFSVSTDENHPMAKLEKLMCIPSDGDAEILRQIQFGCNEQLLDIQKRMVENSNGNNVLDDCEGQQNEDLLTTELQNCIATIQMNLRGIQNQRIPKSHETSIEAHRLMALALSLLGDNKSAIVHHEIFLNAVLPIKEMFDPVALSTSMLVYARDLAKARRLNESYSKVSFAYDYAKSSLGARHSFVLRILEEFDVKCVYDRSFKRQRL